jgi:hypothetical protein
LRGNRCDYVQLQEEKIASWHVYWQLRGTMPTAHFRGGVKSKQSRHAAPN